MNYYLLRTSFLSCIEDIGTHMKVFGFSVPSNSLSVDSLMQRMGLTPGRHLTHETVSAGF